MFAGTIERKFKLLRHDLFLDICPNSLFTPNVTTVLFAKSIIINPGDVVFDIGTGLGPLAIWAAKEQSLFVYGVEIIQEQYHIAVKNAIKNGVEDKLKIYHGSLFEPIPEGVRANVIIGDVSGIAENIARIMSTRGERWYPDQVPTGGEDGTEVIISLLEQSVNWLEPKGRLYFPIAGLSDHRKVLEIAKTKFKNLKTKVKKHFPLEPGQKELIEEAGIPWTYELGKKGSRNIWMGWIYEASCPI